MQQQQRNFLKHDIFRVFTSRYDNGSLIEALAVELRPFNQEVVGSILAGSWPFHLFLLLLPLSFKSRCCIKASS